MPLLVELKTCPRWKTLAKNLAFKKIWRTCGNGSFDRGLSAGLKSRAGYYPRSAAGSV